MSIAITVMFGLLFSIFLAEGWLKVRKKQPKRSEADVVEKQNVVFHSTLITATPAPLKVFHFVEGKVEGRLVMHGPYQGVVTRILMLWKEDKHRCIKMDGLYAVKIDSIEKVYSTSLDEAKTIAKAVYGKRKKPTTSTTERGVPQRKAEVSTAVQVDVKPVSEAAIPLKTQPTIKGFIAQYVGTLVDAGMQSHVTTRNGAPEKYDTFTVTLSTEDGTERLTGNDLRRAVTHEGVKVGDFIRVIHVKDIDLPNGHKKKSFEVAKQPQQAA